MVEGFNNFRVGYMEGHIFELSALVGSRRIKGDIKTQFFKYRIDRRQAGTVQGRIDDFQMAFLGKGYLADGIIISIVHVFFDKFDESLFFGLTKINLFYFRDIFGYLIDQILIIRGYELPAVLIINLFAVIGRQIVAGAEHVSGNGVQIADGER